VVEHASHWTIVSPTYVITNHQCHRRTDRRTDGRYAIPRPRICTKVHCAVKMTVIRTHLDWILNGTAKVTWLRHGYFSYIVIN